MLVSIRTTLPQVNLAKLDSVRRPPSTTNGNNDLVASPGSALRHEWGRVRVRLAELRRAPMAARSLDDRGAVGESHMPNDSGFRRLVAFSDAVVAIAITLLILPLVDVAGTIGSESIGTFLGDNRTKLLAFLLSFTVIGRFWWAQHQAHERVVAYNSVFVSGMFVWLSGIVFLPFPTELLSSAVKSGSGIHALYVGTLLVATIGGLVQQFAVVHWPELQDEDHRGRPG